MALPWILIVGGSVVFGASFALFAVWLADGIIFHPFSLLLTIVASPFFVAMGFTAKRELEDS